MVRRPNTKPKSEQAFKIDVRELRRKGSLVPGATSFSRCFLNGTLMAEVMMSADQDRIVIHTNPEQHIPLTSTTCHYGGSRYWFQCPRCKKRVAILYSFNGPFSCRTCLRVAYYSQSETGLDRLIRKKNKLRRQLACNGLEDFGIYQKPKGMHHRTFNQLIYDFESLNRKISQKMVQRFGSEWA